jgi:hypothetical protein
LLYTTYFECTNLTHPISQDVFNTKPITISFPSKQYGRGGFTMTRLWDKYLTL